MVTVSCKISGKLAFISISVNIHGHKAITHWQHDSKNHCLKHKILCLSVSWTSYRCLKQIFRGTKWTSGYSSASKQLTLPSIKGFPWTDNLLSVIVLFWRCGLLGILHPWTNCRTKYRKLHVFRSIVCISVAIKPSIQLPANIHCRNQLNTNLHNFSSP